MSAIFYLKDGSILEIKGDWGSYNNQTYDMKFRDNIETKYKENYIFSDKLDYMNSKQLLTVSGNVKSQSVQGDIEADLLSFDLSLNTLDISMFTEDQINVKMKNKTYKVLTLEEWDKAQKSGLIITTLDQKAGFVH